MRTKLTIPTFFLAVFFLGLVNSSFHQNSESLKQHHAYFLKHHPFNKNLNLAKSVRFNQGIPPNKYFEREYLLEMNPALGRPTPEKLALLQDEQNNKLKGLRAPGDASNNTWVERGPNNIGGRTRALLYDPNDATHKRVFAGGVSGGLWVNSDITNANSAWTRINGISENISVTAFTVDPNNPNNIYVATGESYVGGDVTGNGVWKSADGGANWTHVFGGSTGATTTNSNGQYLVAGQYNVNDIKAWNNGGTTVIFAAVGANSFRFSGVNATFIGGFQYGFYSSNNNGASWTKIGIFENSTNTPIPYEINDIEIAADNSIWLATKSNVFGTGGGTILTSTNGATFTVKKSITDGKRTQIATSATNAGTFYVLAQLSTAGTPIAFIKTTNGFASTSNLTLPNDADNDIPANDFTRTQAFYNLLLEVDPANDAIVYAGGIDLFRSTSSGSAWTQITKWSNNANLNSLNVPTVHADFHALTFNPANTNTALIGNDGGVYYASSLSGALASTTAISSRNKNYNITQFYSAAIGQNTSTDLFLGGAQDNGSLFVTAAVPSLNGFTDIFGGDGAAEFIDKDGAYLIVSYTNNTYSKFPLPYTGAGEVVIQNDDATGDFINAADLDDQLDILYADGTINASSTYQISRYSALNASPVRTNLTNALLTGEPTAFKVSPFTTTSSLLLVGTDNGKLLKLTNANTATPTWSNLSVAGFVGSISAIEFGANENEIIVTFHNYGVANVWYSSNGGMSWSNKEGDLPDLPIKAVLMNPLNNDEVILGTDLGVWRTASFKTASPTWVQSQNGMQNAKVTSFDLRTADNTVLAATYGRGLFTGTFTTGTLATPNYELSKRAFTVYPTVSNGQISIKAKQNLGQTQISIYDMSGREVYKSQLLLNQAAITDLNLNLKRGIYIFKAKANNQVFSQKIIIK